MKKTCRRILALLCAAVATGSALARPVSFVPIDERLTTAGQPAPYQFDDLREAGYDLVINLSPAGPRSVRDEGYRVAEGWMTYVQIPVDLFEPADRDFRTFRDILRANRDRRVLVHCTSNRRAAAFVFIYRVLEEGVDVEEARRALYAVWVPNAAWRDFISRQLFDAGIDFE